MIGIVIWPNSGTIASGTAIQVVRLDVRVIIGLYGVLAKSDRKTGHGP